VKFLKKGDGIDSEEEADQTMMGAMNRRISVSPLRGDGRNETQAIGYWLLAGIQLFTKIISTK